MGAKRLNELSDLIAPRASVFQGVERVPITDVIESIQSTSTRHSVLLDGVACEHALVYLQNFYRDDPRIHVAPSFWIESEARRTGYSYANPDQVGGPSNQDHGRNSK